MRFWPVFRPYNVNEKLHLIGRWSAAKFDAGQVPTFGAYKRLRIDEMSERNLRSFALQFCKGQNMKQVAGLDQLLKNAYSNAVYFTKCRVGTGTTDPTPADADVEGLISPTHDVNEFLESGQTAIWKVFFTSAENLGIFGNGMICTGSPGTALSHWEFDPTIDHGGSDTVILTYTLGAS